MVCAWNHDGRKPHPCESVVIGLGCVSHNGFGSKPVSAGSHAHADSDQRRRVFLRTGTAAGDAGAALLPVRDRACPFCTPQLGARVGFPVNDYWPLLTHQFLHGGWLHIIGNMWTLWIFGDNV